MSALEQATEWAPPSVVDVAVTEVKSCTSCGAALPGAYCESCGQAQVERLTIPGVLARAARKVLRLDFNFLRTAVDLLRRPGRMIREYVSGKRKPYTNPLGYALLCITAFVAVDNLLASEVARLVDPVLWFGALSQYLGVVLIIPAAAGLRWLFAKRDLTHAETYTFVLYAGSQIVLFEIPMLALTDWTQLSWFRIPAVLLEAGFTAWALTRFLDDRRVSVWARGLLTYLFMAASVVLPLYLLTRDIFSFSTQ